MSTKTDETNEMYIHIRKSFYNSEIHKFNAHKNAVSENHGISCSQK